MTVYKAGRSPSWFLVSNLEHPGPAVCIKHDIAAQQVTAALFPVNGIHGVVQDNGCVCRQHTLERHQRVRKTPWREDGRLVSASESK